MVEALFVSLKLSFATTFITLIIVFPLALALAYGSFKGKLILEALLTLPLLLPPTVLGFYLILAFSPNSPVGGLLEELFGTTPLFNFWGLLLGSVIYSLPFGAFPIRDALRSVDRRYIYTSYLFGYSKLETLFRVIIPNAKEGIITAAALVFAHTMGEFGVVLMVGGNIPGETRTLSVYVYDEVQALNYSQAYRASLTLLAVSVLSLSLILLLRRRVRR